MERQPRPQVTLRRIRTTVTQDDDGNCTVIEHDLLHGLHRTAGHFPVDQRKVVLDDGMEAMQDCAQIRAIMFAQTYEKLVNEGHIQMG